MKIAFPVFHLSLCGGVRVTLQLANGLAKKGHTVYLILPENAYICHFPIYKEVILIKVPQTIIKGRLGEAISLTRNIPYCDVIVATMFLTAYPALLVKLLGKCRKVIYFVQHFEPYIFGEASNYRYFFKKLAAFIACITYRFPFEIVAVSNWLKNRLKSITNKEIHLINPGIEEIFFTHSPYIEKNTDLPMIFTIGRSLSYKGFPDVLKAFRLVLKDIKAKLVIASPEPLSIKSEPFMKVVYPQSDQQLRDLYCRATIFVHTPWLEGFGLPPLEAMACKTPVVLSSCGGPMDYAIHEHNALIVPPNNPPAIASSILRLLNDQELKDKIVASGEITAKKFTVNEMVNKFDMLLN